MRVLHCVQSQCASVQHQRCLMQTICPKGSPRPRFNLLTTSPQSGIKLRPILGSDCRVCCTNHVDFESIVPMRFRLHLHFRAVRRRAVCHGKQALTEYTAAESLQKPSSHLTFDSVSCTRHEGAFSPKAPIRLHSLDIFGGLQHLQAPLTPSQWVGRLAMADGKMIWLHPNRDPSVSSTSSLDSSCSSSSAAVWLVSRLQSFSYLSQNSRSTCHRGCTAQRVRRSGSKTAIFLTGATCSATDRLST